MIETIKNIKSVDLVRRIAFGQADALVFRSRTIMAFTAANAIASTMRHVASVKPNFRMIFAAAPSQSEVLDALTAIPNLPWDQVIAFHMDDYLGLPAAAPQRFANWLDDHPRFHAQRPGRNHSTVAGRNRTQGDCQSPGRQQSD